MSLAHVSRPRAVAICSVSALLLVITALCLAPQAHATTPVLPQFTAAQSVVPTATQLYYPYRVAVDASGNVYISDTDANEVLKESPSQGVYTETVIVPASGGLSSPFGIAVDSSGNVYVVDNGNNRVVKETPSAGSYTQSVVATSELNYPTGIAVDASGNLYIADTQNGRLLKETPSSDSYTETVVGNSGLPQIVGVAVDSSGNLYCNDVDSMAIYEFTYSEGSYTMSTLSISGLNYPWDVAVDSSDNLYIDDNGNSRVLKETYSSPGNYTQSVVPTYNLGGSLGLAVDASGDLYLADTYSMNVKELAVAGGNLGRVNLTGAGQIAMLFDFVGGSGTVSVAGTLVVTQGSSALDYSDSGSGTCTSGSYAAGDICAILVNFAPQYPGLRLGAAGLFVGSGMSAFGYLQGVGSGPEVNFPTGTSVLIAGTAQPFGLSDPYDSAVDASGNVYIVDNVNNAVYMETLTSGSYTQSTVASGLSGPEAVAVDGAGYVYIADTGNNRIVEETNSNGNWTQTTVATGLDSPTGVAVDGTGNVYVSSFTDGAIYKETPSQGAYTQSTLVSGLNESRKIAIDAWGDLYIANTGASQILMETLSAGNYTQTSIGSGLSYAWGVAVTPSGNVLIADTQNSRILLETLSDGTYTQSVLKTGVWAVAVQADDQGTVYIPSTASQTVVKIVSTQPPSLTFASTNLGSTSSDSPQTVVLQNVGNANLNFILPESGTNPSISSGFQLASSNEGNCPSLTGSSEPQSLAPGASCTLPISFMPVSAGADEGSVTLVDNSMNAYPDSIQSIPLTGQGNGKSTTTTAASATAPFSTSAQNVALSASVTSTTTVNAGTVTFTVLHGSTVIGESATSSALTNGNASVSYSLPANTAAGSYTIQAAYSGSGAFEASSNATHTLTIGNGATFALVSTSASTVTQTVAPGQSATYSLAIQAQNTPLTTAVVFSATGLPTGATATFDPPSITPGLTASTFTMTIHTATSYAAASFAHRDLLARGSLVLASSPFMLGILLLPFSGRIRRAAGGHGRKLSLLLLLVVGTALAGLTGCSGYSTSTSQKSYTVTVVGTSGATSHSTTVNLVIE